MDKSFLLIALLMYVTKADCQTNAWKRVTLPVNDGLHDIELVEAKNILTYTYGTGKVFRSIDLGKNWSEVFTGDSIYYEQIAFYQSNGWIVGDHGIILRSKDGGITWEKDSIQLKACGRLLLYGLLALTPKEVLASGGCLTNKKLAPKMIRSQDGGVTWMELPAPYFFYNLEQILDKGIIATGDNIAATFENGQWTTIFQDTSKTVGQIRDIDFDHSGLMAMGGFNGGIAVSMDRGAHWTISKITNNRIRSIAIVNQNIYAVGDQNKEPGSMWVSTNYGKSFSTISGFGDIHRIAKRKKSLWIVGKNGFAAALDKP